MTELKKEVALTNGSSPIGAYLAKHGVGASGTFIKFAKDGVFRNAPGHGVVLIGIGEKCCQALGQSGFGLFCRGLLKSTRKRRANGCGCDARSC